VELDSKRRSSQCGGSRCRREVVRVTLSCQHCGSTVRLVDSSDHGEATVEHYECVACSATGTYEFGPDTDQMTGCLTDDGSYEVAV
jgi:hypothetical protein